MGGSEGRRKGRGKISMSCGTLSAHPEARSNLSPILPPVLARSIFSTLNNK